MQQGEYEYDYHAEENDEDDHPGSGCLMWSQSDVSLPPLSDYPLSAIVSPYHELQSVVSCGTTGGGSSDDSVDQQQQQQQQNTTVRVEPGSHATAITTTTTKATTTTTTDTIANKNSSNSNDDNDAGNFTTAHEPSGCDALDFVNSMLVPDTASALAFAPSARPASNHRATTESTPAAPPFPSEPHPTPLHHYSLNRHHYYYHHHHDPSQAPPMMDHSTASSRRSAPAAVPVPWVANHHQHPYNNSTSLYGISSDHISGSYHHVRSFSVGGGGGDRRRRSSSHSSSNSTLHHPLVLDGTRETPILPNTVVPGFLGNIWGGGNHHHEEDDKAMTHHRQGLGPSVSPSQSFGSETGSSQCFLDALPTVNAAWHHSMSLSSSSRARWQRPFPMVRVPPPPPPPPPVSRAKRLWQRLREYVRSGAFLVDKPELSSSSDPENRTQRREKAQKALRHVMELPLLYQCALMFCLHIFISVIAFSFVLSNWSIVDSIYFSVVTFTTVGFGDLVPDTHLARVFTCFFSVSGVICLGFIIGAVGNTVIETQEKALEKADQLTKQRLLALVSQKYRGGGINTDSSQNSSKTASATAAVTSTIPVDDTQTTTTNTTGLNSSQPLSAPLSKSSSPGAVAANPSKTPRPFAPPPEVPASPRSLRQPNKKKTRAMLFRIMSEFGFVLAILVIFGVVVAQDPAIEYYDVPYFVITTSTTCGFGDMAPVSQLGRLATAIFIPLAVGFMGNWMAFIARWIIERRRQKNFRRHMESRDINLSDLEAMAEDGDGSTVTKAEFLEFMLIAMRKVDRDLMDELDAHFRRLDVDGSGVLSRDDLIVHARRKLKDPARKLELARYKTKLLSQQQKQLSQPGAMGLTNNAAVSGILNSISEIRHLSSSSFGLGRSFQRQESSCSSSRPATPATGPITTDAGADVTRTTAAAWIEDTTAEQIELTLPSLT